MREPIVSSDFVTYIRSYYICRHEACWSYRKQFETVRMVRMAMEVQKKVTPIAAPRQAQNSLAYYSAHLRSTVKSKNKICEEKAIWPIFELPSVKKK